MNKKQQITEKQQLELIQFNRSKIYRIPKKYSFLQEMIKPVKQDLLQIFKYALKHGLFRYRGRYTFVAGNDVLTYEVRKRTTTAVTNRHINYLVALKLICKETGSTKANEEFRKQHPDLLPIGQYSIPRYTPERLALIEEQAEKMKKAGITAGNISQHQLFFNGFPEQALKQYRYNNRQAIGNREIEKGVLFDVISSLVNENGCATKKELYEDDRFGGAGEVDKVFRIFKQDFLKQYNYKRPTKAEKEKFGLTGNYWIITEKEKKGDLKNG